MTDTPKAGYDDLGNEVCCWHGHVNCAGCCVAGVCQLHPNTSDYEPTPEELRAWSAKLATVREPLCRCGHDEAAHVHVDQIGPCCKVCRHSDVARADFPYGGYHVFEPGAVITASVSE